MEQKQPPAPPLSHAEQAARFIAAQLSEGFHLNELVPAHERFATLLAAAGLTDEDAAGLLDLARPTVWRTRAGTRSPSFDVATRIEAVFGIPAGHWLGVPDAVKTNGAAVRAHVAKLTTAKKTARKARK